MTISNPVQGLASPWLVPASPLMQSTVVPGNAFGTNTAGTMSPFISGGFGTTQGNSFLSGGGLFATQPLDSFSPLTTASPFSAPFTGTAMYTAPYSISSPYGTNGTDLTQAVYSLLGSLQSLLGTLLSSLMGGQSGIGSIDGQIPATNSNIPNIPSTGSETPATPDNTASGSQGSGKKCNGGGHGKKHCGGKNDQGGNSAGSANGSGKAGSSGGYNSGSTQQPTTTDGMSMQSTLPESSTTQTEAQPTASPPAPQNDVSNSNQGGGITIDHNGFNDAQVAQLQKYIDFLSKDADGAKLLAAANKDGAGITLKYAPNYKDGGAAYSNNTILIPDSFLKQMNDNSDYPIFALAHEMVHAASDGGQDHYGKTEEVLASVVGDRVKARYLGKPEGADGDRKSYDQWLTYSNNDSYYGSLADNPEALQELESKGITFNL